MSSTIATPARTETIAWNRLLWAGLLAALAAAAANALVYFTASALGFIPQSYIIPSAGQPLTLTPVVGSTIVGAAGATIALAIVARFARRPIRLFRIISVVVLLLSFGTLLSAPGAPVSMLVSLGLMHIVAAVIIVGTLTTVARRT